MTTKNKFKSNLAIENFKKEVNKIETSLKSLKIEISHSAVLELWSKFNDYPNWQTAQALLTKDNKKPIKEDNSEKYLTAEMTKEESGAIAYLRRQSSDIGVFAEILRSIPIFVVEDPNLLIKYKHGFHTESAIFVPHTMLRNIDEKTINKLNENIINIVLDLMDHTYDMAMNMQERNVILTKAMKAEPIEKYVKSEFVPLNHLEDLAKSIGVPENNMNYEVIAMDNKKIGLILIESKEMKDSENPISYYQDTINEKMNKPINVISKTIKIN